MLIVCPSCATSYEVELASLGLRGRQVRCVRCSSVWHAEPTRAQKLMAAAAALGPAPARGAAEDAAYTHVEEATAAAGMSGGDPFDPMADQPGHDDLWREAFPPQPEAAADLPFPAAIDDPAELAAPPIAQMDGAGGDPSFEIGADDFAEHRVARLADIESAAARRGRGTALRPQAQWALARWQSVILGLILVDCILIGWRSDFVRALPQTASFYAMIGLPVNLRGLVFDGITTTMEQHEGVPILVVEGNVVNATRKSVELSRLKFVVRNAARQEIYSWTSVPSRPLLPGGEAVAFRTRLASPPAEGRDVVVRFVNRHDIVAATH